MTNPPQDPSAQWNGDTGARWVAHQEELDATLAPIGRIALDRAAARLGERVLDVGCGCGASALELADRVAPDGSVLGVDISAPMLARARERAASRVNARFLLADAATHAFDAGAFDLLFSRFGVMFFPDPAAAFANLHAALSPQGRLAFVCWRAPAENPWMTLPVRAAATVISTPPPVSPSPDEPGPFAFADAARVRGILERAGFRDVAIEPADHVMSLGADLDRAVEGSLLMGPAARLVAGADAGTLDRVRDALHDALAGFVAPDGVHLAGATWMVNARRG